MALTAAGVSFAVDGRALLSEVSVAFEASSLGLVVGPNGAGKSTLVKVLCRQLAPDAGEVRYGGRALGAWSDAELATVRAVLSQSVELAFPLRVWEVVMMGRYPHFTGRPGGKDERACEEAMRFFDVWAWADRNYLTLSGGERQRVQFARVMAQIWDSAPGRTRYLVLDEPLTFLDIRYQFEFMRRVRELMQAGDLVVVGVVHDLNLAARFADHLVLVHEGRALASGAPADVLTPELIEQAFGIRPTVHSVGGRLHLLFE